MQPEVAQVRRLVAEARDVLDIRGILQPEDGPRLPPEAADPLVQFAGRDGAPAADRPA